MLDMPGISSPFGGNDESDAAFEEYDEFDESTIPTPGPFLDGQNILTGEEHVAFHETTREIFEERGVYDMTFGYNLARLNLDTRHPDAGFRYAEEEANPSILRAEFTPTTPFCPQSDTLGKGSFRAWNGLSENHDYELVRVRVADTHHMNDEINETLRELEAEFRETGELNSPDS